jgi:hypothetical protein
LGEISYVEEMRILEDKVILDLDRISSLIYIVKVKTESKDIVPITGLIMGRFHRQILLFIVSLIGWYRLENELYTVLEVWDRNPNDNSISTVTNRTDG